MCWSRKIASARHIHFFTHPCVEKKTPPSNSNVTSKTTKININSPIATKSQIFSFCIDVPDSLRELPPSAPDVRARVSVVIGGAVVSGVAHTGNGQVCVP